ncbi:hypothetical protein MMC18_005514 [Xylographa bjoerkii]|nr:hypothetical protein [Xylographa bjoerkii]
MPAGSAESIHTFSTGGYESARASAKKHVDLSRWTGDSTENGVDVSATASTEKELVEQKVEEGKGDTGEGKKTEKKEKKKVAESEPTPPPNPMPATPSSPSQGVKGLEKRKLPGTGEGTEGGMKTDV